MKKNHSCTVLLILGIGAAMTLVAYAGRGYVASFGSTSVCDGRSQADCSGVCLVSLASADIYCLPNVAGASTKCEPDGVKNVTIQDYSGSCTWLALLGTCECMPVGDPYNTSSGSMQTYKTTGPFPEA